MGWHPPSGSADRLFTHNVPEQWVQSHTGAPLTFVTDGVATAVERAREMAGDKDVGVPFFEHVKTAPILLDGRTVTEGGRVTHLHHIVRKP